MTHFEWLMSDRRYMGAAFAARGQTSDAAFDAFPNVQITKYPLHRRFGVAEKCPLCHQMVFKIISVTNESW